MLRLAASLTDQAPVGLGEAITGIDDRNGLVLERPVTLSPPGWLLTVTHRSAATSIEPGLLQIGLLWTSGGEVSG